MSPLLSGAISELASAMRFRVARQGLLASNVSNADTPGYRRRDLSFDDALAGAAAQLQRTDPRHLPGAAAAGARVLRGPRGTRPDGNGVDLDRELIALNRNAGAFQDQAAVLSRLLTLRRMGASGDAR